MMKNVIWMMCLAVVIGLGSAAMAADIETVPVGNPGNADDTHGDGYGAVAYQYNIGKYEVTAGQYRDFLNAVAADDTYGLYNSYMDSNDYGCQITRHGDSGNYTYDFSGRPSGDESDWVDRPVNFVSWGDSVRFANWLTNGQPGLGGPPVPQDSNSTESGSYVLNDAMSDAELLAVSVPDATQRATWAGGSKPYYLLTSEDEWYKAAYYTTDLDKNGTHDDPGYFDYPTSSDTTPSNDLDLGGNNATFHDGNAYTIGSPYYRTKVGAHENSDSPYGTFDQGGNVWEWNEAIITGKSSRALRGGSVYDSDDNLHASNRSYFGSPTSGNLSSIGFRVSEVPEPATMAILMLGAIGMLRRRKCVQR